MMSKILQNKSVLLNSATRSSTSIGKAIIGNNLLVNNFIGLDSIGSKHTGIRSYSSNNSVPSYDGYLSLWNGEKDCLYINVHIKQLLCDDEGHAKVTSIVDYYLNDYVVMEAFNQEGVRLTRSHQCDATQYDSVETCVWSLILDLYKLGLYDEECISKNDVLDNSISVVVTGLYSFDESMSDDESSDISDNITSAYSNQATGCSPLGYNELGRTIVNGVQNNRQYSTKTKSDGEKASIGEIAYSLRLGSLKVYLANRGYECSRANQLFIEDFLNDVSEETVSKTSALGLKPGVFNGKVVRSVDYYQDEWKKYIANINRGSSKVDHKEAIKTVTEAVGEDYLMRVLAYNLLCVISNKGVSNSKYNLLSSFSVEMGKEIYQKFLKAKKDEKDLKDLSI